MEIVPVGPDGPNLEPIFRDFRRHEKAADMVLESLVGALATRQAQALVALVQGRPAGLIVLSASGESGRIHFLHAIGGAPEVLEALLMQAEETLRSAGSARLSATLFLPAEGVLESAMLHHGYQGFPRARMLLDLEAPAFQEHPPAGYSLIPWQESRQEEAVALIERAYRDTDDALLYPELSGPDGLRRLVERAVAGEFGPFVAALAPMALEGDTLVGLCLSTWHEAFPDQGFILDLAVDPPHRRRGLGRALVIATAGAFRRAGASALGLAVTLSNRPAVQLYENLGFQVEQRFGVFRKMLSPERK